MSHKVHTIGFLISLISKMDIVSLLIQNKFTKSISFLLKYFYQPEVNTEALLVIYLELKKILIKKDNLSFIKLMIKLDEKLKVSECFVDFLLRTIYYQL
jgi:hypothetical protein